MQIFQILNILGLLTPCLGFSFRPITSMGYLMKNDPIKWFPSNILAPDRSYRLAETTSDNYEQNDDNNSVRPSILLVGVNQTIGHEIIKNINSFSTNNKFREIHAVIDNINSSFLQSNNKISEPVKIKYHYADTMNSEDIKQLVKKIKPNIILSCLGCEMTDSKEILDKAQEINGHLNLIEAIITAQKNSDYVLDKFVAVSSVGAGDSKDTIPSISADYLSDWLDVKSKMEKIIQESNLNYCIVRLCPLEDSCDSNETVITEGSNVYGQTSPAGAAKCVLECCLSPKVNCKIVSAINQDKLLHANPFVRPYEFYEKPNWKKMDLK